MTTTQPNPTTYTRPLIGYERTCAALLQQVQTGEVLAFRRPRPSLGARPLMGYERTCATLLAHDAIPALRAA